MNTKNGISPSCYILILSACFLFLQGYSAVSYLLSVRASHDSVSPKRLPAEKNQGYQVLIFDGIEPAAGR